MIGKTISHYKILSELGRGGMGVVYKAEDTKLQRTVALKFLASQIIGTGEERSRFIHEARAAAALNHPNICTIYEIDEAQEHPFIAMEYVKGENLTEKIRAGPLKLSETIEIAIQIAKGLQDAHEQDIVHRDIKSANIMLTAKDQVKIMDFGLAKIAGRTQLTKEGTTLGTVAYMSPEQARGEPVDHRTDIWSLGVILHEMITGKRPFKGDYEQAILYAILNEQPEPVTSLRTGVPVAMENVIGKALAKDPDERYQHADELAADLRVLQRESGCAEKQRPAARVDSKRSVPVAFIMVLIVIVALVILGRVFLFPERAGPIDSIAVLPLQNLSGDPAQEYFVDGMTEALIADMAKIGALRIISRTSVMRYKDTEKSLPEIAKDLNVDGVIEGSMFLAGDSVRITAQLIEAATDRHIWAESYERDLRDILSLQREVARAIAYEVEATLTPQEEVTLAEAPRVDPEAHEAYLKGRYYWNMRTRESLRRSIEYFEEAIAIDPGYALAYAGLAQAYVVSGEWGYRPPKKMHSMAMETIQKALALDENLAEAYAAVGIIEHEYNYDQRAAEEAYKKAIELNPNYATAHQWYAEYLYHMKRFDKANVEINRAIDLDPLSLVMPCVRSSVYFYSGLYDKSIAAADEALQLDKDFWLAHFLIFRNYLLKGMNDEAFEALKTYLSVIGLSEHHIASLDQVYRREGIDSVDRWWVDVGYRLIGQDYNAPFFRAVSFARLGEIDSAFVCLEKSYEAGGMPILTLDVEPSFESMRSDPRYDELLKKLGYQE